MNPILIAVLVLAGIGFVASLLLVIAAKFMAVPVDERFPVIRGCLPGANCGACGYAGCDAMAAAIVQGEAPVNGCPVGGAAAAKKIGAIMGQDAEGVERKVAFVRCKGSCEVTGNQGNYIGIADCRTAALNGIRFTDCDYGCLGLGSCVKVCPENAIRIENGVAVVDRSKCVGCGLCAKTCPRGLIELIPDSKRVIVQCSNKDKGPQVKKVCSAGCIGCMLCTRQCESGAITVADNLVRVNYEACTQCGKCAEKCPVKVITPPAKAKTVSQ
jgi:RnfABCDGE-type electron transport complex B subunit